MHVLIADGYALYREALEALLELGGIELIRTARNGREAVELARLVQPDVALIDLDLSGLSGLAVTRLIKATQPDVKVVILTLGEDEADLLAAIEAGAEGYLVKNSSADVLYATLAAIGRGEVLLSAGLARLLLRSSIPRPAAILAGSDSGGLTPRERQLLQLVAHRSATTPELAAALGTTAQTVQYHLHRILTRVHARHRAEVITEAVRLGLPGGLGAARG